MKFIPILFIASWCTFSPELGSDIIASPLSAYDSLDSAIITVSKHIKLYKASFSDRTDSYTTNAPGVEMLMFKNNIRGIVMNSGGSPNFGWNQKQQDAYTSGVIDWGVYMNLALASNPSNLAATASSTTSGIGKIRNGKLPTALSYASGITSYVSPTDTYGLMNIFLGGSNSVEDSSKYRYSGLTAAQLINNAMTFHCEMYQNNQSVGFSRLSQIIPRVISHEGWYHNFTHWHNLTGDFEKLYLHKLDSLIGPDGYRGSYSDIVEYFFVRESIDSVAHSGKTVTIYYHKDYPNSPYDRITIPAWLIVDLSNTVYAGNGITVSHGGKIRDMGNDVYGIAVNLDYNQSSTSFTIESGAGVYIDLSPATVTRSGNTINSTKPVKICVWSKPKTNPYEIQVALFGTTNRKQTFATSHTITGTLNTTTTDYYVGWITEDGVSGVFQF